MTYGFIGLGLIGGSLAINLKKTDPDCKIMAYTRTRATCEKALHRKTIDVICESSEDERFLDCDMIFLCAPAEWNISVLPGLKKVLNKHCLLTDVGSVKQPIERELPGLIL